MAPSTVRGRGDRPSSDANDASLRGLLCGLELKGTDPVPVGMGVLATIAAAADAAARGGGDASVRGGEE